MYFVTMSARVESSQTWLSTRVAKKSERNGEVSDRAYVSCSAQGSVNPQRPHFQRLMHRE
jgi:hypothetical protein